MRTLIVLAMSSIALFGQPAATKTAWEYASVTADIDSQYSGTSFDPATGKATICYATADGCRTEEVVVQSRTNPHNLGEVALMKASAMLGEQGWEIVGVTEWRPDESNRVPRLRHVFRRPK